MGRTFSDFTLPEYSERLNNILRTEIEKAQNDTPISLLFEAQVYHKMGYIV